MRALPSSRVSLVLATVAGAGLSTQSFVNGQLSESLGAPSLAAAVNQVVGFTALVVVGIATGALLRGWRRLRAGARLRWWHVAASANGALFLTVAAAAAPKIGMALLTVALVSGQTAASLVIDRLGLSPAGPRRLTAVRVIGVAIAVAAVAIGASGPHGDPHLGLLALAVAGGAGTALVQAALGHVSRATGEPLFAGGVSFAVGGVAALLLALVATGGAAPGGWSAHPELWIGGVIGAFVAVVMALTVGTLGALRLTLGLVAGQSAGGILLDLIAPAAGEGVTLRTTVSVLLTFVAVAVSGLVLPRAPTRLATPRSARVGTLRRECPGPADPG